MKFNKNVVTLAIMVGAFVCQGAALAAGPNVVTAPNSDPTCFAPWASNTKLLQYAAKKGPYRIAL